MKVESNCILVSETHTPIQVVIVVGYELHRLMMDSFEVYLKKHGGLFTLGKNRECVYLTFDETGPDFKALLAVISRYLIATDCTYTVEDKSRDGDFHYAFDVLNMYELRFDKIKEK